MCLWSSKRLILPEQRDQGKNSRRYYERGSQDPDGVGSYIGHCNDLGAYSEGQVPQKSLESQSDMNSQTTECTDGEQGERCNDQLGGQCNNPGER